MYVLRSQKKGLALEAGKIVQQKFLNSEVIKNKLEDPAVFQSIQPGIEKYITYFLEEKLIKKYPIINMLGGDELIGKIKKNLLEEMEFVIPQVLQKYAGTLQEKIPIDEIVQNEIMQISEARVQRIFLQKSKKYLGFIPLAGAISGLLIGLILILLLKANF